MNIAIIGAAYTGLEAARHFKAQGHTVTVTTTSPSRVDELSQVADRVIVMRGSDREGMQELLPGQDILLLTMAGGMTEKDGKPFMDPELYRDAYVGTAESVVECLNVAPDLNLMLFTSSLNAYGDAGGAESVDEETPATPSEIQAVFVEAENTLAEAASDHLRVCLYRTGTIYGPGREMKNEVAQIAGMSIPFDGDSDAMIIHRDDVVRAMDFAIDNRLSGMYNLFNDVSDSKSDLFAAICEREGLQPVTWLGLSKGPRNVSNAKIKSTGFEFADPLAQRETENLCQT